MAYEKQTWECGDDISAERLNHMEEGIAEASGYECKETVLTDETLTAR